MPILCFLLLVSYNIFVNYLNVQLQTRYLPATQHLHQSRNKKTKSRPCIWSVNRSPLSFWPLRSSQDFLHYLSWAQGHFESTRLRHQKVRGRAIGQRVRCLGKREDPLWGLHRDHEAKIRGAWPNRGNPKSLPFVRHRRKGKDLAYRPEKSSKGAGRSIERIRTNSDDRRIRPRWRRPK